MNRWLFLFSLVVTTSCHYRYVELQEARPIAKSELKQSVVPLRQEDISPLALSWDARLSFVNFKPKEEKKVRDAVKIIKQVIVSHEFKERVLNYRFKGERKFNGNDGLTNEEIYLKILKGAEQIGNKQNNNTMDVELELYHQKTNTIGYTYPNTVRIWMNTKYFSKYTPVKIADNLMHEWMHKLGFSHEIAWTKDRDHSVPYAIGYIVEELASKL